MNIACGLPVLLLFNLDNSWPEVDRSEVQELVMSLRDELIALGHPVRTACLQDKRLADLLGTYDPSKWIVFNWCEEIPGIPHSCARVARALEDAGFTFTGAGTQALQFSQDKPAVKQRLHSLGIPTPRWQVFDHPREMDWKSFPAIVKPAYEHSSLGITHKSVVNDRYELKNQVDDMINTFQQPILVENYLSGREFHLSIVGNGHLQVFPIAEMDYLSIPDETRRLCTYDSKFTPASADYKNIQLRLPAELGEKEKQHLEAIAISAYQACGCRDYARLDIRQQEDTFYVLDVNPNADLSPDTSLALSAEFAGYSYAAFISLLISLATRRHPSIESSKASSVFKNGFENILDLKGEKCLEL